GALDFIRADFDRLELYLNRGPRATPPYSFGNGSQDPNLTLDDTRAPYDFNAEGAGILDFDNDGWLDFVFQNDSGIRLYRNSGDGENFVLVAEASSNLPTGPSMATGEGDYLAVADFDVDGDVDLVVRTEDYSEIFRNAGDGSFVNAGPNIAVTESSKGGASFCDFDNDNDFDLLLVDGADNGAGVYLNDGGSFGDQPAFSVPVSVEVNGTACGDIDHDGDVDILLTTEGMDRLYLNTLEAGQLDFTQMNMGIDSSDIGLATVLVDIDRDGDLDAWVAQTGTTDIVNMMPVPNPARNRVFRNGRDDTNYLMVEVLTEVQDCSDGRVLRPDTGAVVSVREAGGQSYGVREISGGGGLGSQTSPLVHFGLPRGPMGNYEATVRFLRAGTMVTLPVVPASLGPYQVLRVEDTDPDGDGVLTVREMMDFADPDPDGDGLPAWLDTDADGDGTLDAAEAGDGDPCTPPVDVDGNGVADYAEGAVQPMMDAGVPDASIDGAVDGSLDASSDGSVMPRVDAGAGPMLLGARGSGLISCAAGGGPVKPSGGVFGVVVLAIALGRISFRSPRR
ncbi:MAG: CRTAC1 family protein, partial [Myxococcota bacterium]